MRTVRAIDLFPQHCAVCGFSWDSTVKDPAVCRRCSRQNFRIPRPAYRRGEYAGHIADPVNNYRTRPAEYRAWSHMRTRCMIPGRKDWARYGGRGIRVCQRWDSFAAFYADMGPKPSRSHSLDRIDVNGNYEAGNCRWATPIQQARNTCRNRVIAFGAKSATLAEWSEHTGLRRETIQDRLNRGWDVATALTRPPQPQFGPRDAVRQIGNAVSVRTAKALAMEVLR